MQTKRMVSQLNANPRLCKELSRTRAAFADRRATEDR
jgi:hypothetical protein